MGKKRVLILITQGTVAGNGWILFVMTSLLHFLTSNIPYEALHKRFSKKKFRQDEVGGNPVKKNKGLNKFKKTEKRPNLKGFELQDYTMNEIYEDEVELLSNYDQLNTSNHTFSSHNIPELSRRYFSRVFNCRSGDVFVNDEFNYRWGRCRNDSSYYENSNINYNKKSGKIENVENNKKNNKIYINCGNKINGEKNYNNFNKNYHNDQSNHHNLSSKSFSKIFLSQKNEEHFEQNSMQYATNNSKWDSTKLNNTTPKLFNNNDVTNHTSLKQPQKQHYPYLLPPSIFFFFLLTSETFFLGVF